MRHLFETIAVLNISIGITLLFMRGFFGSLMSEDARLHIAELRDGDAEKMTVIPFEWVREIFSLLPKNLGAMMAGLILLVVAVPGLVIAEGLALAVRGLCRIGSPFGIFRREEGRR
jgi:hypothetical protein